MSEDLKDMLERISGLSMSTFIGALTIKNHLLALMRLLYNLQQFLEDLALSVIKTYAKKQITK